MNRVKPGVGYGWLSVTGQHCVFLESVWWGLGIDNGVWNQVISATLPPSGIHKKQFSGRGVDLLKITNNPL